jgi:hypothetical protein
MKMRSVSRQYKSICQLSGKISNHWLFVQIFNREILLSIFKGTLNLGRAKNQGGELKSMNKKFESLLENVSALLLIRTLSI